MFGFQALLKLKVKQCWLSEEIATAKVMFIDIRIKEKLIEKSKTKIS
jgi:hypothetical protein